MIESRRQTSPGEVRSRSCEMRIPSPSIPDHPKDERNDICVLNQAGRSPLSAPFTPNSLPLCGQRAQFKKRSFNGSANPTNRGDRTRTTRPNGIRNPVARQWQNNAAVRFGTYVESGARVVIFWMRIFLTIRPTHTHAHERCLSKSRKNFSRQYLCMHLLVVPLEAKLQSFVGSYYTWKMI